MASVLRMRAFAVLYVAETVSIAGDQLARVALSVLIFDRTGSTGATALTYALTYVPAIAGGAVLGRTGRLLPVRQTMIGCEVVRAVLFAVMAVNGLPTGAILGLLVAAVFFSPAFSASAVAYLSGEMDPPSFRAGTGLRMITNQIAQVAGFAVGGVLVVALDPRGALVVDAATFAFSAVLIVAVLPRRSAERMHGNNRSIPAAARATDHHFAGLWGDRAVRWLVLLGALAGFFVVPEALAVPLADDSSRSAVTAGLLLAALPLGGAVGAVAILRWVPPARAHQAAGILAMWCGVPLLVTAFDPPLWVTLTGWCLSGALAAYQVEIVALVVQAVPEAARTATIAQASAILLGVQGLGLALFGVLGGAIGPGPSVAVAGACGSAAAVSLVTARHRFTTSA